MQDLTFDLTYDWINPYVCKFGLFQIISTKKELQEWLRLAPKVIALDTETMGDYSVAKTNEQKSWTLDKGGLDTQRCKVLLTSLAYESSAAVIDHSKLDPKTTFECVLDRELIMCNAKFDAAIMERILGKRVKVKADIMDAYGMVTAGIRPTWTTLKGLNLGNIAKHILNIKLNKETRKTFESGIITLESMIYSAEDAYSTFLAWEEMKGKLNHIFYDIEMPLNYVLQRLQVRGVEINKEEAQEMSKILDERLAVLTDKLAELGIDNPNSQQTVSAYFNSLGLELDSLDSDALEKLKDDGNEVAKYLYAYRHVNKFQTSFLLPWTTKHLSPFTGRIHPSFTQTAVETGRLSCREPNMQQIPKASKLPELADIDIRGLISPGTGNLLVTADYSQYELRVLAELSKDRRMKIEYDNEYEELLNLWERMRIFGVEKWQSEEVEKFLASDEIAKEIKHKLSFLDKHTQTAATVFNIPADQVQKTQRSQAKAISFGIVYGMGADSLARDLTETMGTKVTTRDAEALLDAYFKKYTGVKSYIERIKRNALRDYACSTPLGRSRRFPIILGKNKRLVSSMCREAVNMTIQGSNGDVTKIALIDLGNTYMDRYPDIWPIMTIHDEIVTVCPETEGNDVARQVERAMIDASKKVLKTIPTSLSITLSDKWEKD